jgi:hypothetical protein
MKVRFSKKSFFKYLIILLCLLTVTVLLGALQLKHSQALHAVTAIMTQHSVLLTAFHWSLILLFIVVWPTFINRLARKGHWTVEKTAFWLHQRVRLSIWLIIFELVICENILLSFFKIF